MIFWGPFKQKVSVRCSTCNTPFRLWTPTYLGPLKCPWCNSKDFTPDGS